MTRYFIAFHVVRVGGIARTLLARKTVIKVSKDARTVAPIQQMYRVCEHEDDSFFQLAKEGLPDRGALEERGPSRDLDLRLESQEGGLTVEERDQVMAEIRSGMTSLLVATDVPCRGIDMPRVALVVSYEMPVLRSWSVNMGTYLHRIGRIGPVRAEGRGVAISLVTADEINSRKEVVDHYQCKVNEIEHDWEEFQDKLLNLRVKRAPEDDGQQ